MVQPAPNFYLGSRDYTGEWARVRACWIERRLSGPYHDQYALVATDPPAPTVDGPSGEPARYLILAPHYNWTTLFPVSEFPLPVYVYEIRNSHVISSDRFQSSDVVTAAWCEIYSTKEEAERIAELE